MTSRDEALKAWAMEVKKVHHPDPGELPIYESRTYLENQWLRAAVNKLGGVKQLAHVISRSPGYIGNVLKGYSPLTKELEEKIQEVLDRQQ